MSVLILSSSPNADGLTAACVEAVAAGLADAGVDRQEIRLTDSDVGNCHQCDDGWGTCRASHFCQVEDGYQQLHQLVLDADALAFVTPVYWGEMSESMKAFTDRLRRCEALREGERPLAGKWLLGVAAAGGGGGGIVTTMGQIDRWVSHVKMRRFDLIGVTKWTREYSLPAIRRSAEALGHGLKTADG